MEILSATGAGVLGLGAGMLMPKGAEGLATFFLVSGVVCHAFAMLQKHRLEKSSGAPIPAWARSFYWFCWLCLGAIAMIAVQQFIKV